MASTERMVEFALLERTKAAWSSPALLGRSAVYWISPAVCQRASTFCLGCETGHMLEHREMSGSEEGKIAPQHQEEKCSPNVFKKSI